MPKGKGKGRQKTNKKKKGSGGAPRERANATHAAANQHALKGEMPDFLAHSCRRPVQPKLRTLYSRYKKATSRFVSYMLDNTPAGAGVNTASVNCLPVSADWMVDTKHILDPHVLKDLKLAIRVRSRVATSYFGGGDVGHKHFLEVLRYCWSKLSLLPKSSRSAEYEYGENPYAALEEEDEDIIEDEDMFPTKPMPRPDVEDAVAMTIDKLMKSDDRVDATIFLLALDDLMSAVAEQYKALTRRAAMSRPSEISSPMVEHLIEAAVATNMAIQQVQDLEMDLQLQHEHLTTPYRLLSTLIMPEISANIANIVRNHASRECSDQDIVVFLGDCIECYFRNSSAGENRRVSIVEDFCTQYGVDSVGSAEVNDLFVGIQMLVTLEVPIGTERATSSQFIRAMESTLPNYGEDSTWLRNMSYIGGDRAIHHTIRLLQLFGDVIKSTPDDRKIIPKRGIFGKSPWVAGRARKIKGDLDELLMSDILPSWVSMCRHGILGKTGLPRENEIAPLFVSLRSYVNDPAKPVTWALAFGVHAMLTGVLETDHSLYKVMDVSRAVFDNYFRQIDRAMLLANNEEEMRHNQSWLHNTSMISFLKNLGLDVYCNSAIWNPVCGGTTFSYTTLFGNLEGGCAVIDCQAQLRITLHLYHALLINGIIRRDQIPMLNRLYDCFKESKAIWDGDLPRRGELVKKFWVCFGLNHVGAKRLAEQAKRIARGVSQTISNVDEDCRASWKQRKMHGIEPSEIATCFRRVCDRDFHDVQDKYHTAEQKKIARGKCHQVSSGGELCYIFSFLYLLRYFAHSFLLIQGTEQYLFAVRLNDTLDSIENDQQLLALNLISCAAYLEQFVCSLTRVLQWEPVLKSGSLIIGEDMRHGFAYLFAQHLLGALDFAQNPMEHEFLGVPLGLASSTFMNCFFERIDPSTVMWFQSIVYED